MSIKIPPVLSKSISVLRLLDRLSTVGLFIWSQLKKLPRGKPKRRPPQIGSGGFR